VVAASERRSVLYRSLRVATVVLAGATVGPAGLAGQQSRPFEGAEFLRIDPERVVLNARDSRVPCGECHTAEYEVWIQTPHAQGFNTLHRSDLAQSILRDMGLRTAKRQESLCLRCHYTVSAPDSTAIAGVSCESCHGAARDWIDVHNQWGPGVEHPDAEDPAHREQRIQGSIAGGMLRPSGDLYSVAANCFECHTVPVEDLVNVGGHPAGSGDFDLVERIGEIRHNFVAAQWGGSTENQPPTPERTRMTYIAGRILDYEYSIRGLAEATTEARFAKSMERRISGAVRNLEAIARVVDVPQINAILAMGREARLTPDNRAELLELAGNVRTLARELLDGQDGTELAALDPLVAGAPPPAPPAPPPGEGGGAAPPPVAEPGAAPSAEPGAEPGAEPASAPPPAGEAAGTRPSEPQPAQPAVVGARHDRPTWFPSPDARYETTQAASECVSCHVPAEDWWYDDAHESSALKLLNRDPKAVQIGSLYGLSADEITLGTRICMNCHGTIETAAPNVQVTMGVSCESCHGPSSEYLEPHSDGGNPQLGMVALRDGEQRAATCSRCHRITDERLLSSGHSSGSDYDIAAANEQIRHWPDERRVGRAKEGRGEPAYVELDGAQLVAAFRAVASSRPIPDVPVAVLAPTPLPTPPAPAGRTAAPVAAAAPPPETVRTGPAIRTTGGEPVQPPPPPPTPRPVPRSAAQSAPAQSAVDVSLPPLPAVDGDTTTEEILLIVKRRLDELYAALGRGGE